MAELVADVRAEEMDVYDRLDRWQRDRVKQTGVIPEDWREPVAE